MSVYFEIAVPELEPIDQDEQTEWDDKPEEEPQECVVRGVRLCLRRKIEMTQFGFVRQIVVAPFRHDSPVADQHQPRIGAHQGFERLGRADSKG